MERETLERLQRLIGEPPEGSHPDEWMPRAETWHQERLNWESEVKQLRGRIKDLERQVDRLETALVEANA